MVDPAPTGVHHLPPAEPGGYLSPSVVLALLSAAAAAALLGLPVVAMAPNRLASGEGFGLVALLDGPLAAPAVGLLAAVLTLLILCCLVQRPGVLPTALALTVGLIPGLLWITGAHAAAVAHTSSALARTALASGFWMTWLLLALLLAELLRRAHAHLTVRWGTALVVAMLVAGLLISGECDGLSLVQEFTGRENAFWQALQRHIVIVGVALGWVVLLGLPLGWLGHRRPRVRQALMPMLNVLQTIPSIALFGLMMAPLGWLAQVLPSWGEAGVSGVGMVPAVIALTAYGLLPVVRSVLAALTELPAGVLQAARSVGLSAWHTLRWVEFPLALPVILGGVRTAAVQLVGLAAVAALIGAGGLGAIMFEGLFSAAQDVVLLGVLPVVALGVLTGATISALTRLTRMARVQALTVSRVRAA